MKIVFHGGAKEVGKSCIELTGQGERYLLDAGLKFKEHGFEAPFDVFEMQKFDGLFLSHAHLDHSGALPLFEHYNLICPVFMTEQTRELTDVLLKDSYKIARIKHLHPAYQKVDIHKVLKATTTVKFDKWYTNKGINFKFINAGHIPGSSMILINIEGKKVLYTGDFRMVDTDLMEGAAKEVDRLLSIGELKDLDVVICESTYGGHNMASRTDTETAFLDHITNVVEKGTGSVVIPVFALGRAQDVLISLSKRKWSVPIYFDGMCIDVTKLILKYDDSYIRNKKILSEMFNRKIELIKKEKTRYQVMGNRGIFVTTSGMLQGGPILGYIENMWGNPNNAILLTGYQCRRTNGQLLQDEGYIYLHGWKTYVKCQVAKYGFSGHADDAQLREFVTKLNPKNLIIDHGDPENSLAFKEWVEKNTQIKVFLPAIGENLEF